MIKHGVTLLQQKTFNTQEHKYNLSPLSVSVRGPQVKRPYVPRPR